MKEETPGTNFSKIKSIEIKTRRLVEEYLSGKYESVFKGTGMNFSDVREYTPGDDIRRIDWNVTARLGKPFVKEFTEERELTILLVVDISASQLFTTKNKTKEETACEIAALLAFSALKNQDKVGLIMFTDGPEKFLPPKKHRHYVLRIIRETLFHKPKNKKTNIAKTLRFINGVFKKKGIIFIISDFIDIGYETLLKVTNKKHDVIAIKISETGETRLPSIGLLEMEDSETGEVITVNTNDASLRKTFSQALQKDMETFKQNLGKAKIDLIEINSDQDYVKPLYTFFKMRESRK